MQRLLQSERMEFEFEFSIDTSSATTEIAKNVLRDCAQRAGVCAVIGIQHAVFCLLQLDA